MNKGKNAWGVQDEWEKWSSNKRQNTLKTKCYKVNSKHDMLRMMEQDIDQGMT